jgi:hypothetical protein
MIMNDQSHNFTPFPYSGPSNHIINDPTPKDQAIYVPSVSPNYAILAHAQKWRRKLPKGIAAGDLNFLDPQNKLFRISHVMSSAGQALNQTRDCIITKRNRAHTVMIGDSGGYQIARDPNMVKDNKDRLKILRWLETHANVAMTLDVPTGPLMKGGYRYTSFQECLDVTLYNLRFFLDHRQKPEVRFLNVLQGNNQEQADAWYNAVKAYPLEGWAFGGILRHNIFQLCRRLIIMYQEGKIQDKSWIHVLGTNELDTAVLLTALQRAINRYMNPNLRISFDTSSPFRIIAWGRVYGLPFFDSNRLSMPTHHILAGKPYLHSAVAWPWPSPLGDRMMMGDLSIPSASNERTFYDTQSNMYLAHHNLAALCFGVATANRAFDAANLSGTHPLAEKVGRAVIAIDEIISSRDLAVLERYRSLLEQLRHGRELHSEDDQRDLTNY